MKNVLLFFSSILIGVISITGYKVWMENKKILPKQKPPEIHSQFSFEKAPSKSLQVTIASFSGTVDWQSRTATQAAKLTTLRNIQQGETVETENDGNVTIQFPQIATISALPNTSLHIIQTLPNNIVIVQDTGIAEYNVTGTVPFAVRSSDLLLESVNGTMDVAAHNNRVTITVLKGSVTAAYNDLQNLSNTVAIDVPHTFIFNNTTKEGVIR